MKLKPVKLAPALIAFGVIVFVCFLQVVQPDLVERVERISYDMRVRLAMRFPNEVSTNLGFVYIGDDSIAAVNDGLLGRPFGLYWPRQIYGRAYRELANQHAAAVGFDVLFSGRREDHSPVTVSGSQWPDLTNFLASLHPRGGTVQFEDNGEMLLSVDSDEYFAWQLHRGGTAIIAAEHDVPPDPLFATNALTIGDIAADSDSDGVLRRAKAFSMYHRWHPVFHQAEAEGYINLKHVRIEPDRIIFIRHDPNDSSISNIVIAIDSNTNFDLTLLAGEELPSGTPRQARAFTDEPVWHMGIALAAQELGLDLSQSEIDLPRGKIVLHGPNGIERIIPVDERGYFYINWELTSTDPRLTSEPIENLLRKDRDRMSGAVTDLNNRWKGKLAIIGSNATGNDLTDRGATPLEKSTFLVTKHWNVANSIIQGRFVHRSPLVLDFAIIAILGAAAAWLTWELRALIALCSIFALAAGYVGLACLAYVQGRFWIPVVLPVLGALTITYALLVTWRVVFEQTERRRVKGIFSRIVSPNIVNELLEAETLALGGARREVTVLFADVRGFTEFTDKKQEQALEHIAANKLSPEEVETYYNEQARDTLSTVNTYLAMLADIVKEHEGTLDKYIGDCVMAFWGAPTPNPKHAACCVRAAVAAQRAFYEFNRKRAEENKSIELENMTRIAGGLPLKPELPILLLGSGINTGLVTVGLMGSEAHIFNYTVFGREVNVASRLESVSGRGRIVISETTYQHLLRDDPQLAATCISLAAEKVKGIRDAVKIYEVPWRPPGSPSLDEEFFAKKHSDTSTALAQREKT